MATCRACGLEVGNGMIAEVGHFDRNHSPMYRNGTWIGHGWHCPCGATEPEPELFYEHIKACAYLPTLRLQYLFGATR